MIKLGHNVFVTGPDNENITKIQKLGVNFIEVPLDKQGLNILSDLKYMKSLKKIMIDNNIDLVFSYTIKPVIFGSLAARKARVKNSYSMITGLGYVYTENSLKVNILRYFVSILYKYSLKNNKKVIFQDKVHIIV